MFFVLFSLRAFTVEIHSWGWGFFVELMRAFTEKQKRDGFYLRGGCDCE